MVIILNRFTKFVAGLNSNLQLYLRQANIKEEAQDYVLKSLGIAGLFSLILLIAPFFIFLKEGFKLAYLFSLFFILFLAVFYILMKMPFLTAIKRKHEIESDLLYSARYLLLRMRTGAPLINALIDASKLHTKSSKYFKEIASRIYLGEPLEKIVDYAYDYTPSRQFKKVLRVIKDSLETGVDIKVNMGITLKEITDEQIVKLELYGKKINSLTMLYMIVGVIGPSLGSSILIIAASFANIEVNMTLLLFIFVFVVTLQCGFVALYKSFRPSVSV